MKLDKVLCGMFLFSFRLDRAQNTIVVYSELKNYPIKTFWLRNSCIALDWANFSSQFIYGLARQTKRKRD